MVADFAGHPPILVGNPVVAIGLVSTIDSSACSDSKENTELNTAMATDMDLEDSASGVVMDKDPAAASDSDTDRAMVDSENGGDMDLDPNISRDGTAMATTTAKSSNTNRNTENSVQPDTDSLDPNISPDSGLDIVPNQLSGSATAIASNLKDGMIMPLEPNKTSETGSDQMDMTTAIETAKDSESLDLNVASDKGSDTVPIQLSVSATAIASLIATQDSDDSNGRFSGSSSEENEFTDDDDITKANKKRKIELSSSSRKKRLPLTTVTTKIRKKSDFPLLYHSGFTMVMRHQNTNQRCSPKQSIDDILSNRRMKNIPTNARLNALVESWSLSSRMKSLTMSTVNSDGIVGEDELSCQSIYEVEMKEIERGYDGLFGNEIFLQEEDLSKIYAKYLQALNDIRLQVAGNQNPVMKVKGQSYNTYIAQLKAKEFVSHVDDIEFQDWCVSNTHAHFWYCPDVLKSPMLKIAIEKALKKSPNADLSESLFDKIHDIREHQFVGFVSSDTIKNNVLNSFHLHSFVTFYTDRHKETIITCILTTRHHIQSNMQDRLMQLVQLIQYAKNGALSMSVSNEVLNVAITANDLRAYESLGFDTASASIQNYDESFSLNIKELIPMVQYRDSNTWAKYCPRLIKLDLFKKGQIKKNLHGTLRSRMIEFLQTDIAETPTYSMNPNIVGEVQQFLLNIVDLDLDKQSLPAKC